MTINHVRELDEILATIEASEQGVPPEFGTGAKFRALVERFGFDDSGLSGVLGYESSTFQQYLKPSVKTNPEVLLKTVRCMRDELRDVPGTLQTFNTKTFCRAKLNLYSAKLQPVPVGKLDIEPRLFSSAEAAANAANQEAEIPWSTWRKNVWERFRNYTGFAFQSHVVCIMGHPGGGKTALLQSLLSDTPYDDFCPVYLPLLVYNRDGDIGSVLKAIGAAYQAAGWHGTINLEGYLSNQLSAGRLLIFADGLDEVVFQKRAQVLGQIRAAKAPIILTTRYVAPRLDAFPELETFHLAGMSRRDMRKHFTYVRDFLSDAGFEGPANDLRSIVAQFGDEHEESDRGARKARRPSTSTNSTFKSESTPLDLFTNPNIRDNAYAASNDGPRGMLLEPNQLGTGIGVVRARKVEEALRDSKQHDRDVDILLSSPIFVNIFIGAIIDRTHVKFTINSLLGRYTDFLFGEWRNSRTPISLGVMSESETLDKDLRQILSIIGFLSCVFEHCLGRPLTKIDVMDHITNFLARLKGDSQASFVDPVKKILQAASDAEIFRADRDFAEEKYCRFKAPEELLAQIFASSFMLTALMMADHPVYMRRIGIEGDKDLPIHYARLKEFARNPNLRFLEEAAVSMLISTVEERVYDLFVEDSVDDLTETLPIDFEFAQRAGVSKEDAQKLLPLNLIVLGRAFSNRDLAHRYGSRAEAVKQKIVAIYLDTNIELVFQSLQPYCDSGLPHDFKKDVSPEVALDREWRLSDSCADLRGIVGEAEKLSEKNKTFIKQMIERRVAYRMRYHWDTFDEKALEWLRQFEDASKKEKRVADHDDAEQLGFTSYTLLVLSTLRVIFANLRGVINPSASQRKLLHGVRGWIAELERKAEPNGMDFDRLAKVLHGGEFDADRVVDTLLPVDKSKRPFPFYVWKNRPGPLSDLILPKKFHDRAKLVARLKKDLEELQRAREAATRSNEQPASYDIQREAACCFLLAMSIDSYESQQLFVPSKYSLKGLGLGKPELDDKEVPYDREELLVDVFRGAKLALGKNLAAGQAESTSLDTRLAVENQGEYSIGGWQLYDYYAQTLWRVLRYVPTAAYFEYLR